VCDALKKKKKPSSVNATPEVVEFISKLEKGSYVDKIITKAIDILDEDMFAGDPVQKKKFPKCYIQEHEIRNLYVMKLNSYRRLTYTLIFDGIGISVNILEIFLSHKEYEQRFGYS
jgi:hypothetical protein